jgi:transposase InsO family protein
MCALATPYFLYDGVANTGHNRVAKIMRDKGWRAKAVKKYKATANSNHSLPVAPNPLEQNFEAKIFSE